MKTRIELFREKLSEKQIESALVTSWQNVSIWFYGIWRCIHIYHKSPSTF